MASNISGDADRSSARAVPALPTPTSLIAAYDADESVRRHTAHNQNLWTWIHGGLALVRRTPLEFDPILEYWRCTERRVLVAYFAKRFHEAYAPAAALRELAVRTFVHFDRARKDSRFGEPVLARTGLWPYLASKILDVARELPALEQYDALRRVWGARLRAKSLRDDLVDFLTDASRLDGPDDVEASFAWRLSWFPYLGLDSTAGLLERQRFFYGYYQGAREGSGGGRHRGPAGHPDCDGASAGGSGSARCARGGMDRIAVPLRGLQGSARAREEARTPRGRGAEVPRSPPRGRGDAHEVGLRAMGRHHTFRLDGFLAKAQRLLNIDGYDVIRLDRERDVVTRGLLLRQFEVE